MIFLPGIKSHYSQLSFTLLCTVYLFLPCVIARERPPYSPSTHFPSIELVKWTEDGEEWMSDYVSVEDALEVQDNGKTWVVSNHIQAIAFTCNASYPVMWVFDHSKYSHDDLFSMRVATLRKSLDSSTSFDLSNPKLQQFYSTIEIYGDYNRMTGKYICQSTQSDKLQSSLHLYWQGVSASYLVLNGETISLKLQENQQSITLPCHVSYPEGQVSLLKQNGKEFQPVISSEGKNGLEVHFDPKIGFALSAGNGNSSLIGTYKCVADNPEDFVIVDVAYGKENNKPSGDVLFGNASFFFDSQKDEIVCCSNSNRPPVLRDIFCSNTPTCRIHEQYLLKVENNGKRYKSGGCISSKVYPRETGMFRCKGDAIDITRHFYTDLSAVGNDAFVTYFNWDQIPAESMMTVVPHFNGTVYNKQIVTASCLILPSYFSEGIRWGLKRKDGSITVLNDEEDIDVFWRGTDEKLHHSIDITVSTDITEIICYAPVWNSSNWIHKSLTLNARESVAPSIENNEIENELILNLDDTEQILECKSTGIPTPEIRWEKNNKVISQKSKNIWQANGTSVYIIPIVTRETQGRFRCTASNWAGTADMFIRVIVQEPSSAWSTASIVTLSIVVVVLAIITGFVVIKMQIKNKIITYLTGALFRDVNDQTVSSSR